MSKNDAVSFEKSSLTRSKERRNSDAKANGMITGSLSIVEKREEDDARS